MESIVAAFDLGVSAAAVAGTDAAKAHGLYRSAVKKLVRATRDESVPAAGVQIAAQLASAMLLRAEAVRHNNDDTPQTVSPQSQRLRPAEIESACAALDKSGLVIFRKGEVGCLPTAKLESLRLAAQRLEKFVVDFTKQSTKHYSFVQFASRCPGRIDVKLLGGVASKSDAGSKFDALVSKFNVQDLAKNGWWRRLVDAALGEDCVLAYAGLVLSQPRSAEQPWHTDGLALFPGAPAMLPAHALNVFVPLVEVTRERGPTQLVPGSHRPEAAAVVQKRLEKGDSPSDTIYAPTLQLGDALIYDQRTVHRGVANVSDETRPILYLLYARPWYRESLNFTDECAFAPRKAAKKRKQPT